MAYAVATMSQRVRTAKKWSLRMHDMRLDESWTGSNLRLPHRHYPMLKSLCFSGVSQDLAIWQTGYITRKCSEKTFPAYNQSVWIRHQRASQIIILLVMPYYLTPRFSLKSTCEVTRLQLRLFCAAVFPICLSCYNYMINLMCRTLLEVLAIV